MFRCNLTFGTDRRLDGVSKLLENAMLAAVEASFVDERRKSDAVPE